MCARCGVVNLATCLCVKSEEEGPGEKKRLQYFEFGLQYLVQPLGVNPTYSTFKAFLINSLVKSVKWILS